MVNTNNFVPHQFKEHEDRSAYDRAYVRVNGIRHKDTDYDRRLSQCISNDAERTNSLVMTLLHDTYRQVEALIKEHHGGEEWESMLHQANRSWYKDHKKKHKRGQRAMKKKNKRTKR